MFNEEREQQMMAEAKAYTYEIYDDESVDFQTKEKIAETIADFCAGWRAAENSRWIFVEKGLPPHRNKSEHKFENDFSENCFVSDGEFVDVGYYDYRLHKWNCQFLTNVTCWYIPQLPRKEE
jgi:hypothetical protein